MKTILAIVGAVTLLVIFGLFALCNDDDDPNSMARVQVAYHDGGGGYDEGDCDWNGDCGGGYDERNGGYGDGRGGDGRFGGGRSGDYDGGPGDDCRNACGNTIIVPTPGDRGGEQR